VDFKDLMGLQEAVAIILGSLRRTSAPSVTIVFSWNLHVAATTYVDFRIPELGEVRLGMVAINGITGADLAHLIATTLENYILAGNIFEWEGSSEEQDKKLLTILLTRIN
jgi:hypothetical protein